MAEFKLPRSTASVSEVLDAATVLFRVTLAKAMPAALFAMLAASLPGMYWQTTGKPMDLLHPPLDARFWALNAVGLLCYQYLAAVLMLRQRAMLGGMAPDLAGEARAALQRWPMLVVTGILCGLAVFVGSLLLIVPGIYLFVCFLLIRPVVLIESGSPLQLLLRCVRLARAMWVKVLAAAVIAGLVIFVCVIAAAACLQIVQAVVVAMGVQPAAMSAFASACQLGLQAVALVYFNALWLVLYTAASSSA